MIRLKKFLVIPAVIVIAVSILSGFSNTTAEKELKVLLKDRTNILQQSFYNQITKEEAEERLTKIETYPLLTEDIHSVRAWEETQLDIVRSMNVESVQQQKNFINYLTYSIVIFWDMSGLDENYTLRGEYFVVLKKENDQYKLSVFDPVQK